jgi:hypothetical protein
VALAHGPPACYKACTRTLVPSTWPTSAVGPGARPTWLWRLPTAFAAGSVSLCPLCLQVQVMVAVQLLFKSWTPVLYSLCTALVMVPDQLMVVQLSVALLAGLSSSTLVDTWWWCCCWWWWCCPSACDLPLRHCTGLLWVPMAAPTTAATAVVLHFVLPRSC